ncbi:kinesin-like protein KIN-7K, chloroplastic [Gossypium australe]|uniref:Kinesin-like protein KIN-7K, chloroplastic n=1 Tax=Gossypium australe TaxID=47621 RepID=A0A5B6UL83_9ROSI|nr:kinesin-like protein KIN-7K, chloroplastic [Gossypium australe]
MKELGSSNLSVLAPPVFDRENYQAWVVRMQVYTESYDYWEVVKQNYEIKLYKEGIIRKVKAKAYLYATVSLAIFNTIMVFRSAKEIWDYLKAEYQGDERIKSMKVLNLIKKFKRLHKKESKLIKEYSDKLIDIANMVRVLETDLFDGGLVQKRLVSVAEKYEATIASLENTKDLT